MKFRRLAAIAVLIPFLFTMGCSTIVADTNKLFGINLTPDTIISTVQGVIEALQWIEPLSLGVITIFMPAAIPACQASIVACNAGILLAQDAIAAYQAAPSEAAYQKLLSSLSDLQAFWNALQQAYQGKYTAPNALAVVSIK